MSDTVPSGEPVVITDAQSLISHPSFELSSVVFYRIEGHLNEDVFAPAIVIDPIDIKFDASYRTADGQLGVRLVVTANLEQGRILVDGAIGYEFDATLQLSEAATVEFVNRAGLMALYPYIRQMFAQMTTNIVGEAILLPLFRQGQITIAGPDDPTGD